MRLLLLIFVSALSACNPVLTVGARSSDAATDRTEAVAPDSGNRAPNPDASMRDAEIDTLALLDSMPARQRLAISYQPNTPLNGSIGTRCVLKNESSEPIASWTVTLTIPGLSLTGAAFVAPADADASTDAWLFTPAPSDGNDIILPGATVFFLVWGTAPPSNCFFADEPCLVE